MSNLFKTTRTSNGITTEQSNVATDITSLGGRTTDATGLVILSNDEHVFLPDTLKDRQAIIDNVGSVVDKLGETLDVMANISATGLLVDTTNVDITFTPTWIQSINTLKDSLDDLTASLNNLKDNLQ